MNPWPVRCFDLCTWFQARYFIICHVVAEFPLGVILNNFVKTNIRTNVTVYLIIYVKLCLSLVYTIIDNIILDATNCAHIWVNT